MSKIIVVDVESDGPFPGPYSMVCFGAVMVDKAGKLENTFYGQTRPVSDGWNPEALAISGFSREEHKTFGDPKEVITNFAGWLDSLPGGKPIFYSDNLAYDWQWINYYFHFYTGKNPFGFSGARIGDIFKGYYNDPFIKYKQHRKTKHTHNPVDDAKGNAECLLYLKSQGYKLF